MLSDFDVADCFTDGCETFACEVCAKHLSRIDTSPIAPVLDDLVPSHTNKFSNFIRSVRELKTHCDCARVQRFSLLK